MRPGSSKKPRVYTATVLKYLEGKTWVSLTRMRQDFQCGGTNNFHDLINSLVKGGVVEKIQRSGKSGRSKTLYRLIVAQEMQRAA